MHFLYYSEQENWAVDIHSSVKISGFYPRYLQDKAGGFLHQWGKSIQTGEHEYSILK